MGVDPGESVASQPELLTSPPASTSGAHPGCKVGVWGGQPGARKAGQCGRAGRLPVLLPGALQPHSCPRSAGHGAASSPPKAFGY